MKFVLKAAILLLLASVCLPWPAIVLIRGLAAGLVGLQRIYWKLTESKDTGIKSVGFFLATLSLLLGFWPLGLLLVFLTIWYDRLAIALVVAAITIEDTRRPEREEPERPEPRPTYQAPREARVHRLPAPVEPERVSAPQARAHAERHFDWDPIEHGLTWDFGHQLWRDKDGWFCQMDGTPVQVRNAI